MLLTCGARGLESPTPCLQTTGGRPCASIPAVTVPGRPSASFWIHPCCGTSVLYIQGPGQAGLGIPEAGSVSAAP